VEASGFAWRLTLSLGFYLISRVSTMSKDSMYNYSNFAWSDALSLAYWLDTEFDLKEVQSAFDAMSQTDRAKFEENNETLIEELLRRTEGQRPAFLRKVVKHASNTSKGLLLVFGIMGLVRVRSLIEIRDWLVLMGPGGSYRVTNARIYEIQKQVEGPMRSLFVREWPEHVFADYNGDDGYFDAEDGEEDDDDSLGE
jgi:hypothetical protein